jgi:hypothetical protein
MKIATAAWLGCSIAGSCPGRIPEATDCESASANGYLNLYAKGQSVAQLRIVAGRPRLKIHAKYRAGAEKGSGAGVGFGRQYDEVSSDDLRAMNADTVDAWIRTAETYAGDEKRFVDDLVAVTPGTVDLEMGLPADAADKARAAPRMDLVVAQGSDIAFWDAKCAANGGLRARKPYNELSGDYLGGPHVLWQLRRYQRWFGRELRATEVRNAYVATACCLIRLAEVFGKTGSAITAWRELVEAGDTGSVNRRESSWLITHHRAATRRLTQRDARIRLESDRLASTKSV